VATLLCKLTDIEDGASKGVYPDKKGYDRILLVRQGNTVFGYVNICPHYGQSRLGWKKDEFLDGDRTAIVCASHGARFRIEDGYCELGPCLGQQLTAVKLEVTDNSVHLLEPI